MMESFKTNIQDKIIETIALFREDLDELEKEFVQKFEQISNFFKMLKPWLFQNRFESFHSYISLSK